VTGTETWLVCGGRDFTDQAQLEQCLDNYVTLLGIPDKLIHGAARGADTLAGSWAISRGIDYAAVPADWKKYGFKAGLIRNQVMLDLYPVTRVIAFPGGTGTAHMIRITTAAGLPVHQPLKDVVG